MYSILPKEYLKMDKIILQDVMKTPMLKTYQEEDLPKKIGRPKGRKRQKVVNVYLSEEEKKRLEDKAHKIGLGLTQYIRLKIFSEE